MNIYQNKKKIGVIHRKFNALENGRFQTEEFVTMQINTMGISQALNLSTETELNPDMSFSSFNFELNSSLFRFNARGYVSKDKLILFTGLPHAQQKTIIPIKDIPHISGNIYEAAFLAGLEKDKTRDFSIFDPSTLGIRKISVTRNADEIIPIMGKRVLTQKFCADFMGAKNCAWLAKDGEVLKETGILGLSMEKVSAEQAREGIATDGGVDFTQIASIPSNRNIAEPSKLTEIKIKIDGIRNLPLFLQGGRQKFHQNILTITKETIPDAASQNEYTVNLSAVFTTVTACSIQCPGNENTGGKNCSAHGQSTDQASKNRSMGLPYRRKKTGFVRAQRFGSFKKQGQAIAMNTRF